MNPTTEAEVDFVPQNAVESISRAEFDVAVQTARKFPRQPAVVKSKMLSIATMDRETAESCFYTLPRGGKKIQGPSVRLAEIAVASYHNLAIATRVISVDTGANPHVVVQAICRDLESNITVSIEKRRRIIPKKSANGRIDEDDINLSANSGSAIAFRDAVFKVVPLAYVKPVFEKCREVAIGDAKTLKDRIVTMIGKFGKMGVTQDRILAYLEKPNIDEITINDVEDLIGVFNAIREQDTTIDEAFPPVKAAGPGGTNQPPAPPAPTAATTTQPSTATTKPAEPEKGKEPAKEAPPTAPATSEAPKTEQSAPAGTPAPAQAEEKKPEAEQKPAEPAKPAEEQKPAAAPVVPSDFLAQCRSTVATLGLTEKQVMRHLQSRKPPVARGTQWALSELAAFKLEALASELAKPEIVEEIRKMKAD